MIQKKVLRPERLRQVPAQFSWIDHRLARENLLAGCDHAAQALYLFLVTVADAQGLSYYSEGSLSRRLKLDAVQLSQARRQLIEADLLAYQKPLYQVLALPTKQLLEPASSGPRQQKPLSLGEILRRAVEGGAS